MMDDVAESMSRVKGKKGVCNMESVRLCTA